MRARPTRRRRPLLSARGRSRALAALVVAAVLGSAGCATEGSAAPAAGSATSFVGGDGSLTVLPQADRRPAPPLAGPTLAGPPVALADYRGKVVVLNVWGSWCPPCRAEAPLLERSWRDLRPRGVQFLGVNVRDRDAAARAFERRFGITYPSIVDRDSRQLLGFGSTLPPQAIPSTIVIDRAGRVAARALGPVTTAKLRAVVEPVLAEAP